jgi:hypothetical protein
MCSFCPQPMRVNEGDSVTHTGFAWGTEVPPTSPTLSMLGPRMGTREGQTRDPLGSPERPQEGGMTGQWHGQERSFYCVFPFFFCPVLRPLGQALFLTVCQHCQTGLTTPILGNYTAEGRRQTRWSSLEVTKTKEAMPRPHGPHRDKQCTACPSEDFPMPGSLESGSTEVGSGIRLAQGLTLSWPCSALRSHQAGSLRKSLALSL